jgi:hypothetical protein
VEGGLVTPIKKHQFYFDVKKAILFGFQVGYDFVWGSGTISVNFLCFHFGYEYTRSGE